MSPRENDSPRVGVVVVNWQRRDATLACLAALRGLAYPDWFLVLVDNGCRDFSAAELARDFPGARYIHSATNLGFAGGSNLGMKKTLADAASYVWFLNNDAEPEPGALQELVAVAEGPPAAAIVGAKILQKRSPRRIDSIALKVDLIRGRIVLVGHDEIDCGRYDGMADALAVTGCAMLVSSAACMRLNGFDEGFSSYLEDADLCLRARAAGLRVAVAPRARILHDRPPSTHGRQSLSSRFLTARNHLTLMERHGYGPGWWRPVRASIVVVLNLLYALRGSGEGSRRARVAAVWRGVRSYRRGHRGP